MNIEFVDEPPVHGSWNKRRRQEVQAFAEALKQHPGRWAVYPWTPHSDTGSRALASRISNGKITTFAHGFQAVSRHGTVYIRYEGGA